MPETRPPSPPRSDRRQSTRLFRTSRREELRLELEHHVQMLADRLEATEGLAADAALREARRRLDRPSLERHIPTATPAAPTSERLIESLSALFRDIGLGVRGLVRRPGYTAATLAALGIGIGGSALVLSLVDSVFLRPLPIPQIDRVVEVYESASENAPRFPLGYPSVVDYRAHVGGGVDLAAYRPLRVGVSAGVQVIEMDASAVTWNYFHTLALTPAAGRFFTASDEVFGASPVAIIGYDLWRSTFDGATSAIGTTIRLGDHPTTIIGVAPEGFRGTTLDRHDQVWFPVPMLPDVTIGLFAQRGTLENRVAIFNTFARLPDHMSATTLEDRLAQLRRQSAETLGPEVVPAIPAGVPPIATAPLADVALGADRGPLLKFVSVVAGLSLFTLLVGTLNATQLRLAHLHTRRTEIGIRRALGASRGQLVRQLVADSLILTAVGTALGLAVSRAVLVALTQFTLPGGVALNRLALALDWKAVLIVTLVAGLAALTASLIPAIAATRIDPLRLIRPRRRHTGRTVLLVSQVALSTALVASAGLFLRTFVDGLRAPLGFSTEDRVALTFAPAAHRQVDVAALAERIYSAAAGTPGIDAVALTAHVPPAPWDSAFLLSAVGEPTPEDRPRIHVNTVLGPFATVMGIPVLEGRDFDLERDRGQRTVVLNEAAAALLFPHGSAIGRELKVFEFERESTRVIGVVANSHALGVSDTDAPFAYMDARNYAYIDFAGRATVIARSRQSPLQALSDLQEALQAATPQVLFTDPRPLERQVLRSLMPQHLGLLLFGIFGISAALLAATGVAGVVAFDLSNRRWETALRHALGADHWQSVWPSVRASVSTAVVGLATGLALTLVLGERMRAFLLDVTLMDPVVVVGTLALLTSAIVGASLLPLLQYGRVDPARVMRQTTDG